MFSRLLCYIRGHRIDKSRTVTQVMVWDGRVSFSWKKTVGHRVVCLRCGKTRTGKVRVVK